MRFLLMFVFILFSTGQVYADGPQAKGQTTKGNYQYYQSFGEPNDTIDFNGDPNTIRNNSGRYFKGKIAQCVHAAPFPNCKKNQVYLLAKGYCQGLEFSDAVSWRTSVDVQRVYLHWVICGR